MSDSVDHVQIKGEPRDEKLGEIKKEGSVTEALKDAEAKKEEEKQVADVDKNVKQRSREFSFLNKDPEYLQSIETKAGTFIIPAQVGSTYWAILKVMYQNVNQKVSADKLCLKVAEIQQDSDPVGWEKYISKLTVKAYRKLEKTHSVKPANSWEDRIIGNAKTLTRTGGNFPYGRRLAERGHKLTYSTIEGKLYFLLTTDNK